MSLSLLLLVLLLLLSPRAANIGVGLGGVVKSIAVCKVLPAGPCVSIIPDDLLSVMLREAPLWTT